MNRHPVQWLDAYLDGELHDDQRIKAANHLAICQECRDRAAESRVISELLEEFKPAKLRLSADDFVALIALKLSSRERISHYPSRSKLSMAWGLVPLGILFGLVFLHAVNLISNFLMLIPGVDEKLVFSFPLKFAAADLSPFVRSTFSAFSGSSLLHWHWSTSLIAIFAFNLVYLSWMVTMLQHRQIENANIN